MKSSFTIIILLLFPAVSLFPAKDTEKIELPRNLIKAEQLISDDLIGNSEEIEKISPEMSESDKKKLYSQFKKGSNERWGGFVLNILPGFGIGSFQQDDKKGGYLQLGMNTLGIASIMGAYLQATGDFPWCSCQSESLKGAPLYIVYGGLMTIGLSYIIGIYRSLTFTDVYNEKLKNVLGLDKLSFDLNLIQERRYAVQAKNSVTENLYYWTFTIKR